MPHAGCALQRKRAVVVLSALLSAGSRDERPGERGSGKESSPRVLALASDGLPAVSSCHAHTPLQHVPCRMLQGHVLLGSTTERMLSPVLHCEPRQLAAAARTSACTAHAVPASSAAQWQGSAAAGASQPLAQLRQAQRAAALREACLGARAPEGTLAVAARSL